MSSMPYSDALKAVASRKPEFARHLLEDTANSLLKGAVDDGRALSCPVGAAGRHRFTGVMEMVRETALKILFQI